MQEKPFQSKFGSMLSLIAAGQVLHKVMDPSCRFHLATSRKNKTTYCGGQNVRDISLYLICYLILINKHKAFIMKYEYMTYFIINIYLERMLSYVEQFKWSLCLNGTIIPERDDDKHLRRISHSNAPRQ